MNAENHMTQKLLISVKLPLCKDMCYTPVYIRVADPLIQKFCKIKEMPMVLITDVLNKTCGRKTNTFDFFFLSGSFYTNFN